MVSSLPNYITISSDPSTDLSRAIGQLNSDKVVVLVDENTKKNCLHLIVIENLHIIEIKSGEINKTLDTCEHIWNQLTEIGCSRKSLLINLGGGVIGDMGGFCASTYKRGIPFINIPTTLLSQVDASIGGKLGIDFNGLKNHIGLFKEPNKVIICSEFLKTLPANELKSGFAEIVKHALIYDTDQWNYLLNTPFNLIDWDDLIAKSVNIKNEIVENDPFEMGLRKILNFGHSLGHAIESHLLNTNHSLLHGEAVAIGMILESHISFQKRMISENELNEIHQFINGTFDLPKDLPDLETLFPYLVQDKKNESGIMNFALLPKIGECQYDVEVTKEEISKSLIAYCS